MRHTEPQFLVKTVFFVWRTQNATSLSLFRTSWSLGFPITLVLWLQKWVFRQENQTGQYIDWIGLGVWLHAVFRDCQLQAMFWKISCVIFSTSVPDLWQEHNLYWRRLKPAAELVNSWGNGCLWWVIKWKQVLLPHKLIYSQMFWNQWSASPFLLANKNTVTYGYALVRASFLLQKKSMFHSFRGGQRHL